MNPREKSFRYFTYIEPVIKAPIVKTYGFPVLTTLAIIIFVLFAIKPTVETILILQKDLANQKEILASATQKSENLSMAITNYRNLNQQKLATIESALPANPQIHTILDSLKEAANVPQASVSAIQFQPISIKKNASVRKNSTLGAIQFTYNIEGTFNSLKKVLQNLQSADRLITIQNISINKLEGTNGLLMSISGNAYYLH